MRHKSTYFKTGYRLLLTPSISLLAISRVSKRCISVSSYSVTRWWWWDGMVTNDWSELAFDPKAVFVTHKLSWFSIKCSGERTDGVLLRFHVWMILNLRRMIYNSDVFSQRTQKESELDKLAEASKYRLRVKKVLECRSYPDNCTMRITFSYYVLNTSYP